MKKISDLKKDAAKKISEHYSRSNLSKFVQLSYPMLLFTAWLAMTSAVPARVWANHPTLTVFTYFVLGTAFLVAPVLALRHYVRTRPFDKRLLPLPFVLLSAMLFLMEYTGGPARFRFLASILVTVLYVLPMVLVSLVFIAAIGRRDRKKAEAEKRKTETEAHGPGKGTSTGLTGTGGESGNGDP